MVQLKETRDIELLAALNEEVQQLHHRMHPHIFKSFDHKAIAAALRLFFEDRSCRAFVAWAGDKAAGYIITFVKQVKENAFHYSRCYVYVDQVAVLEQFQKQGVGELLLLKAEEIAKELSIDTLELDHWTSNIVAAAYFRKQGYELRKERLGRQL